MVGDFLGRHNRRLDWEIHCLCQEPSAAEAE